MAIKLTFKECSSVALRAILNEFPLQKLRAFAKRNDLPDNMDKAKTIDTIVCVKDSIDATIQTL